jgi:hypothetical protein
MDDTIISNSTKDNSGFSKETEFSSSFENQSLDNADLD